MTKPAWLHGWFFGAATVAALTLAAPTAQAQVDCVDLPNPVIGTGGSGIRRLIGPIAAASRDISSPITIIYQRASSCFGVTHYVDDTTMTGTANYWDSDGTEQTCDLPVSGVSPDFGALGVGPTLCSGVDAVPDGIGQFSGPVHGWSLIVPVGSSQQVISAEALYFLYGFGPEEGMVSPWTNSAYSWGRGASSGTLISIALSAGVPPEVMAAQFAPEQDPGSTSGMITAVASAAEPEAAIGFVGGEHADAARDSVRTLAYQAYGQDCGYYPDSTPTAFDKQNIRDGHYSLWSAFQFLAPVGDDGLPSDPETAQFIGYFTDNVPDDLPFIDLMVEAGYIPRCAMGVWRDTDQGPLYSYQPEEPCVGIFEELATGSTDATSCTGDTDCPSEFPTCRYGYCEVQ